MSGEMATLIPALLLCFIVSEITSVSSGPGESPADNPNTPPNERYFSVVREMRIIIWIIVELLLSLVFG